MAFMINPAKRFKETGVLTRPNYKGSPGSIREAFFVDQVYDRGIFRIEAEGGLSLYDRSYVFYDINYINRDREEKKSLLLKLAAFLAFMSCDFKITVANEYRNMHSFIKTVFNDLNKEKYPEISRGMKEWIEEMLKEGEIRDVEKVLYLTITVKAYNYEDARSYFTGMDIQLENMFLSMGSMILPLTTRQRLESIRKFFYLDTDTIPVDPKRNADDPIKDILPVSVEAGERDFMVFNQNRYVSVLFGRNFASSIDEENLIQKLTKVSYPSYVTIDYAPVERGTLKSYLTYLHTSAERAISQELDEKNRNGMMLSGISYTKEKNMEELETIADQIDEHDESCLLVGLLVMVSAETEELLAKRIESMQHNGKENGVMLEPYSYVQLKAFNTALPIGGRYVGHRRAFLTGSLVSMQPFFAQDHCEEGGFFYGLNRTTHQMVIRNRKTLASPHGMIVGHTGSGKSMEIKMTEVSQTLLSTSDDLTVIDPQNEMEGICAVYGGQFIDFTPKSESYINPMEIPYEIRMSKEKRMQNRFVADVTTWANSFCAAIMHNILYTQEHRSAVGECVRAIYDRIFASSDRKFQPTICDLREELKNMADTSDNSQYRSEILRIYNSLTEYTVGAYDMFAHSSNVDLTNRFVVFGLHNVPEDSWEPVMISIMFFLSSRMEYNQRLQKATRLIIDEAQTVAKNQTSADIMLRAIVTYRKYGGICTLALQNLTRALENPELRDMFSNCGYKLFLDQGGVDARHLSEIQELSETEYKSLAEEVPGRGLMVWGKKVIMLDTRMNKDNVLYERFSTNFHEKKKKEMALQAPEEGGITGKLLKMAEIVPITAGDAAKTLDLTAEEASELMDDLYEQGYLVRHRQGGQMKYKTKIL